MPKATSSTSERGPRAVPALPRNKACIQCRRRKIKCDAQRPCKSCVRHHATIIAQRAVQGQPFPQTPECTYDEDNLESSETTSANVPTIVFSSGSSTHSPQSDGTSPQRSGSDLSPLSGAAAVDFDTTTQHLPTSGFTPPADLFDYLSTVSTNTPAQTTGDTESTSPSPPAPNLSLIFPNYPENLPHPELLFHLIDVFFSSVPFATQLLHKPSFLTSLSYPPGDARFPHATILHAISGLASIYSPVIEPSVPIMGPIIQVFRDLRERQSFQDLQCELATALSTYESRSGRHHMQCLQARIIVNWYNTSVANLAEAWTGAGNLTRHCVPLGINASDTYDSIIDQGWKKTIIAPPKDDLERELRKNAFWLAFIADRFQSAITGWPISLDEADIGQELPLPIFLVDQGKSHLFERQNLFSPDLFTRHGPETTDSFVLLIKSFIILSRVTTFNIRTRTHMETSSGGEVKDSTTITESSAFKTLDSLLHKFKLSFPTAFRDPLNRKGAGSLVDPLLYCAHATYFTAVILLHDPHADVSSPNCTQSQKVLGAARAILNSVYSLTATSYDIGLLPCYTEWYWTVTAKALMRFYKHRYKVGLSDEAEALRGEIEVLTLACHRAGERLPTALQTYYSLNRLFSVTKADAEEEVISNPGNTKTSHSNINIPGFSNEAAAMSSV